MKSYVKPEIEYISMITEDVATTNGEIGIISSPFEYEEGAELE